MPRSEALKEAQKRYRAKQDKYENIKKINAKSNKKRYAEDETFRENAKMKQREYYLKRKEKKQQEQEQDIKENQEVQEVQENQEEQKL
jgi:hypothetical protein